MKGRVKGLEEVFPATLESNNLKGEVPKYMKYCLSDFYLGKKKKPKPYTMEFTWEYC